MTSPERGRVSAWSRRQALRLLGLGGVSLAAACGSAPESNEPAEDSPAPAGSALPEDAIVRTILEDVAPDDLSHGALLFHEHMSLDIPFWDRLVGAENPARESFIGSAGSPYFMQDVEAMVEELQAAPAKESRRSSTAVMRTWAGTSRFCARSRSDPGCPSS